ncbi:MAG: nickel pincer cofactor biosynthesis protein LarC [Deltaproteobacteria bacterium]|nr:nickel pincer cofactor biosynthesis protein LarC [Deltaproteobacteria bacterium]
MRIAYFDCFSGICGNMILGGLLDLGVPRALMEEGLGRLGLEPFEISASVEERAHLRGTHVSVRIGNGPARERSFEQIRDLIGKSSLNRRVKEMSLAAFRRLAVAEGMVHREEPDRVHFHEVGAVDSIVDIVGAFIGVDYLGLEGVYVSRIPLGRGMVSSRHGRLPVPAPATLELLKDVPVYDSGVEAEMVTPTGAAWITTLAREFGILPDMRIERVGYGLGDRDLGSIPNVLRILLGEPALSPVQDRVLVVETDIDDMNPEFFEPLMERLFSRGALDVAFLPIQMKKSRPGVMVRVICEEPLRERIVETILQESTSIGVRYFPVQRGKLERRIEQVETPFGVVRVKVSQDRSGKIRRLSPEYEDCLRLSKETGNPIIEIYQETLLAARKAVTGR